MTETAGLPRMHAYVEIRVSADKSSEISNSICIKEKDSSRLIRGQVLDSTVQSSADKVYTCLFPVSIEANETKMYEVVCGKGPFHEEQLKSDGTPLNLKVENSFFISDLTDIKATPENGLGSGQLAG